MHEAVRKALHKFGNLLESWRIPAVTWTRKIL
jgi:hypothetical protein